MHSLFSHFRAPLSLSLPWDLRSHSEICPMGEQFSWRPMTSHKPITTVELELQYVFGAPTGICESGQPDSRKSRTEGTISENEKEHL
jgi:hypothetical protein